MGHDWNPIHMHEVPGESAGEQKRNMSFPKPASHVRLKNILYATDFSLAAEKALPFALQIARRYGAALHVLHVVRPGVYPLVPPAGWMQAEKEEEASRKKYRKELEAQLGELAHEIVYKEGEVWEGIQEAIRENEIDLLVIGTHGRIGLEKATLGSVAEQALRHASCPTLTIGPKVAAQPTRPAGWTRILYATDFSTASLAGARHAISLAREHRAQLILLHCAEPGADVQVMLHTVRDLVPFGSDLRAEPDCVVAHGSPTEKILEVAEEHGADIIVLGVDAAEGKLGKKVHINQTGIYEILTRAACPVLTVRA